MAYSPASLANGFAQGVQNYYSQTQAGLCPHCGYCPHCGRQGNQQTYQHPYWAGTIGGLAGSNVELQMQCGDSLATAT